jgi:protocatechuate 3,4-dioxygenase beta subunit
VAVDAAGNVYVADSANSTIRKITPAGVVTTLAGTPGQPGSSDGIGTAAQFNQPFGVAVDGAGNVYVADLDNGTIRMITPAGVVSTFAGTAGQIGSADGIGSAARFNQPFGVAVDGAGNDYVADRNNHTIRKITPAGLVTTLAGTAGQVGSGDGTGSAARFHFPQGVAVDGAGDVYVADEFNDTIRKLSIPTVPAQSGLTGTNSVAVTAALTGLTPSTTYFDRVVATNADGTTFGTILSFTTPMGPVATGISATAGTPQSATVSTAFATALQATVKDQNGNPFPGATVTFTAPAGGAGGTFPSGLTTVTAMTNASGVATAPTFTANSTAGSYTVTASVAGPVTPASFSLTNNPLVATTITATAGTPQGATVSTVFGAALQATVKDQFGNLLPDVTVTFTAPASGASGTFPGGLTTVTAMTNASGVATAPTFTANGTAGSYTVTASMTGPAPPASFSLTNNPLVATTITATAGTPQSATVSTAFATALQATVQDQNGNPLPDVTVTFTAPAGGAGGTFPGGLTTMTATTNASGVATAPTFTVNGTPGSYTVTASVAGPVTPASFSLTNNPLVATTITATAGTLQSAMVSTAFATGLQATVQDQNGNPLSGATVTFTAPASSASGTFPGGLTIVTATTNAGGVATAPTFTANGTAGGYTVTASVAGVATSASFGLTNVTSTPAEVATIQFASPTFPANVTDGTTQIGLIRAGNLSATVTVVVSSPGGPDVAAFQQTVTFGPNTTSAFVTVPIQNDGKPGEPDVSIPLSLSSPGPGATLGASTSATLVVHDNNPLPPVVTVASFQPTTVKITTGTGKRQKTKTETGLLLGFSGNLTGTGNSAAYQLLTGTTRKGKTTLNKNVPLTVFNATPTSVTLLPSGKFNLSLSQPAQLRVATADLTDAFGRPLNGGRSFAATFGNKAVTSAGVKSQSRIGILSASTVDAE